MIFIIIWFDIASEEIELNANPFNPFLCQYLNIFWHNLGNPVDYSQISQDSINLRKRIEEYVKMK